LLASSRAGERLCKKPSRECLTVMRDGRDNASARFFLPAALTQGRTLLQIDITADLDSGSGS
jgi:hypothetical protein